jgi:hypothetical protein
VAAGEATWTAEDIDLALEWQAENRLRCGGCGHPLDESADPKNMRHYQAEEMTCFGCMVTELRRKALSDQDRDTAGLHVYARKVAS